jgi:hypothetical protein
MGDVEVGHHRFGDGTLRSIGAFAGVSGGVEADGAGRFNLLAALLADDLGEGEERCACGRRDGLEVSLDEIEQAVSDTGDGCALGGGCGGEEGVSEAEGLPGLCGGLRCGGLSDWLFDRGGWVGGLPRRLL